MTSCANSDSVEGAGLRSRGCLGERKRRKTNANDAKIEKTIRCTDSVSPPEQQQQHCVLVLIRSGNDSGAMWGWDSWGLAAVAALPSIAAVSIATVPIVRSWRSLCHGRGSGSPKQ